MRVRPNHRSPTLPVGCPPGSPRVTPRSRILGLAGGGGRGYDAGVSYRLFENRISTTFGRCRWLESARPSNPTSQRAVIDTSAPTAAPKKRGRFA